MRVGCSLSHHQIFARSLFALPDDKLTLSMVLYRSTTHQVTRVLWRVLVGVPSERPIALYLRTPVAQNRGVRPT